MRTEAEMGLRHDGHGTSYMRFGGAAWDDYEVKEEMSTDWLLCREYHDLEHRKRPKRKRRG